MNLKITTIQANLHWENVAENLNEFSLQIDAISEETDIIVLPEMFNTGFSMDSKKLAEPMNGETVIWMKKQATKIDAVIVGSLIVVEENKYYNRLIWTQPDGLIYTYDKRHLFRMAGEHEHFSAGKERLIINYKGWRICPLVCYDLRFPVWSRNTSLNSHNSSSVYDLLIYIANWPAVRKAPWSKLLEARAIENQCYVVGVNRVGLDRTQNEYSGNSVVLNPKGDAIFSAPENENSCVTTSISLSKLNEFRKAFPVGLDGDNLSLL